ncbi:MAG: hypothetical protein QNJ81_12465, partial [Acidimicrobiia bacterium]|nr:hypothetical protein [Acidimicrobiia bacterium]
WVGHGGGLFLGPHNRYVRTMFWLRQPPYLRWIVAALVLIAGIAFDMRADPTTPYPFATEAIGAGTRVDSFVEWRPIPTGVLPEGSGPGSGIAAVDIEAGSPLLPGLVSEVSVPEGWWAVPLSLPHRVSPGTAIRVATADGVSEGFVAGEVIDNGYEVIAPVAFPAAQAAAVAIAASNSALVVMVGAQSSVAESAG